MASTAIPDGEEGHLSLSQERDGFWAEAPQPIDTTYTSDVRKLAKTGILGMSFGFEVTKDDWFDDQGRSSNAQIGAKRIIREVKLHEVSTTAFPAYGSTMGTVSARDSVNAARGIEATRAAKAGYADLETCGECGAEGQYGAFCSGCGEAMTAPASQGTLYCSQCGSLVDDGDRDAHVCKETRTVSAEVDATLDAAFKEIESVDRNALPAEVNQFIDLASAALKLASADLKDSGTPDPDKPNGNDYSEAGSATSADESERADMALLAEHIRLMAEF